MPTPDPLDGLVDHLVERIIERLGLAKSQSMERPLTIEEWAEFNKVSRSTAFEAIRRGAPHLKIGSRILVLQSEMVQHFHVGASDD